MNITKHDILRLYTTKKYRYIDDIGKANVFGIRKYNGKVNKFDDIVGILYNTTAGWDMKIYPATTDPGIFYLKKLLNPKGTAIVLEGQYTDSHMVGLHQGKYTALVQNPKGTPITVIRDNNRNEVLDSNMPLESGYFGINIHHAAVNSVARFVERYSAGCQVIQKIEDFNDFMTIVLRSKTMHGNKFDYTLFNEIELYKTIPTSNIPIRGVQVIEQRDPNI